MNISRNLLVSFDAKTCTYKVNFEVVEDTGHGVEWQSGGTLLTVSTVGTRLVALDAKSKKPLFTWANQWEMTEELTQKYECAVKLL